MKSKININGNRLEITRTFDAPRCDVFSCWAEAEKLRQWSGCKEAIECQVEMDFRVGGWFSQKMKIAVNGQVCDFHLKGIYEEIVVPQRISYRAYIGQQVMPVRVEFFEEGDRTRVVLTQDGFTNLESCKIVSLGTSESLDKLDSILKRRNVTGLLRAEVG